MLAYSSHLATIDVCEEEVIEYDPCQGIEEYMRERSYKRGKGGAIKQHK